ncbi:adenosine deaminase [Povalibacter uvarum]|uniref:Adenine deaminase n=1 Tax=Povalibacter uvarum TaxID=732238 RepID=A0A841HUE3_9GAMM|nr:adenosine deaminase [Povalibacter uvarum]MBB6096264.1 adenosine deaminase [Povalibacter uvarum]
MQSTDSNSTGQAGPSDQASSFDRAGLDDFIAGLPKAELHVHIEGTLEPELMFELARRNRAPIPFASVADVRNAYSFTNLQDFLDIYYQGAQVLQVEEDFRDLALAYFARAVQDNVRHTEIFFDPQTHTDRGVPFRVVIEGLLAAGKEAKTRWGLSSKLILCFLRHLDEAAAFAVLSSAEPWLDRIEAVGLDSSEVGHPPSKFERVFARAADMGLRRVAHAGEEGPPEYVEEALDLLRVDRIDHGNRALESETLVARLASTAMTLTVCPLSNLKLCVVKDLAKHPIPRMLRSGLCATINSDDPAYFGGYINDNYRAVAPLLGREGLATAARNSFVGSFLDADATAVQLAGLDRYLEGRG